MSTITSQSPANTSTLAGAFEEITDKLAADFDDCLPARVVSYNREKNTATVQPLIQRLKTDGTVLSRPTIENIPCVSMGSGRAVLTFTLEEGDLGWIKATDRDISLYLESLTERPPHTLRKHNFSDAIFLADAWAEFVLDSGDNDALVLLQTADATQRIVLKPSESKIVSNTLITLDSPTTNTSGNTNLGNTGAAQGIARLGDTVEINIVPGIPLVDPSTGITNVTTTLSGTITTASAANTAS